jgi:hypothetical protein
VFVNADGIVSDERLRELVAMLPATNVSNASTANAATTSSTIADTTHETAARARLRHALATVEQLTLDYVWLERPLVNGGELMRELGVPAGPQVKLVRDLRCACVRYRTRSSLGGR